MSHLCLLAQVNWVVQDWSCIEEAVRVCMLHCSFDIAWKKNSPTGWLKSLLTSDFLHFIMQETNIAWRNWTGEVNSIFLLSHITCHLMCASLNQIQALNLFGNASSTSCKTFCGIFSHSFLRICFRDMTLSRIYSRLWSLECPRWHSPGKWSWEA